MGAPRNSRHNVKAFRTVPGKKTLCQSFEIRRTWTESTRTDSRPSIDHLPRVEGFHLEMDSSSNSDLSDLVQAVQSDQELQQVVGTLASYFGIDSIPENDGYSEVRCSYDVSPALEKVRDEFKKEYVAKKISDIVKTMVRHPGKVHYLSRRVSLLVFQSGWSELAEIMGKENCYILIPSVIKGSGEVTIEERSTGRRTTAKFELNSKLIIRGSSSLWLPPQSKVVCIVLGAGKG